MTATVTFKGVDEVKDRLAVLIQTSKPAIKEAIWNAAASTIAATATDICPKDTGALSQSILPKDESEGDEVKITVGPRIEGLQKQDVYYAPYIEFGTGIYAENGNGRQTGWAYEGSGHKWGGFHFTRGYRAHPYLRPAFEQRKEDCVKMTAYNLKAWAGGNK